MTSSSYDSSESSTDESKSDLDSFSTTGTTNNSRSDASGSSTESSSVSSSSSDSLSSASSLSDSSSGSISGSSSSSRSNDTSSESSSDQSSSSSNSSTSSSSSSTTSGDQRRNTDTSTTFTDYNDIKTSKSFTAYKIDLEYAQQEDVKLTKPKEINEDDVIIGTKENGEKIYTSSNNQFIKYGYVRALDVKQIPNEYLHKFDSEKFFKAESRNRTIRVNNKKIQNYLVLDDSKNLIYNSNYNLSEEYKRYKGKIYVYDLDNLKDHKLATQKLKMGIFDNEKVKIDINLIPDLNKGKQISHHLSSRERTALKTKIKKKQFEEINIDVDGENIRLSLVFHRGNWYKVEDVKIALKSSPEDFLDRVVKPFSLTSFTKFTGHNIPINNLNNLKEIARYLPRTIGSKPAPYLANYGLDYNIEESDKNYLVRVEYNSGTYKQYIDIRKVPPGYFDKLLKNATAQSYKYAGKDQDQIQQYVDISRYGLKYVDINTINKSDYKKIKKDEVSTVSNNFNQYILVHKGKALSKEKFDNLVKKNKIAEIDYINSQTIKKYLDDAKTQNHDTKISDKKLYFDSKRAIVKDFNPNKSFVLMNEFNGRFIRTNLPNLSNFNLTGTDRIDYINRNYALLDFRNNVALDKENEEVFKSDLQKITKITRKSTKHYMKLLGTDAIPVINDKAQLPLYFNEEKHVIGEDEASGQFYIINRLDLLPNRELKDNYELNRFFDKLKIFSLEKNHLGDYVTKEPDTENIENLLEALTLEHLGNETTNLKRFSFERSKGDGKKYKECSVTDLYKFMKENLGGVETDARGGETRILSKDKSTIDSFYEALPHIELPETTMTVSYNDKVYYIHKDSLIGKFNNGKLDILGYEIDTIELENLTVNRIGSPLSDSEEHLFKKPRYILQESIEISQSNNNRDFEEETTIAESALRPQQVKTQSKGGLWSWVKKTNNEDKKGDKEKNETIKGILKNNKPSESNAEEDSQKKPSAIRRVEIRTPKKDKGNTR